MSFLMEDPFSLSDAFVSDAKGLLVCSDEKCGWLDAAVTSFFWLTSGTFFTLFHTGVELTLHTINHST